MIRNIKNSVILTLLLFGIIYVKPAAGQSDTTAQYRDFLTLCTQYQYAPLQLNIKYHSDNNLVLNTYDTMSMQGYFYIGGNGVYYLRMGDTEQFISDSIAFMVNHTLQQVIINSDADNARNLLKRYLGTVTNDTSFQTLMTAYSIQQANSGGNKYLLTGRTMLPGTNIFRQSIELKYNAVKREPLEITTTRRSLVAIDAADSLAFAQKFAGQNVLVTLPGKGLYFVRTYTAVYTYESIQHEEPASLPMQAADYIRRNENGEYELVPAKSSYRLRYD